MSINMTYRWWAKPCTNATHYCRSLSSKSLCSSKSGSKRLPRAKGWWTKSPEAADTAYLTWIRGDREAQGGVGHPTLGEHCWWSLRALLGFASVRVSAGPTLPGWIARICQNWNSTQPGNHLLVHQPILCTLTLTRCWSGVNSRRVSVRWQDKGEKRETGCVLGLPCFLNRSHLRKLRDVYRSFPFRGRNEWLVRWQSREGRKGWWKLSLKSGQRGGQR